MTAGSRPDRQWWTGSPGFTLVEVLVGLAVAGLLLALLDGMVLQFARSADHMEAAAAGVEAEDDCARVVRLLLADVEMDGRGAPSANLVGGRDELIVTTRGPRIMGLSSPAQFRLHLVAENGQASRQKGDGSQSLVLEWRRPEGGASGRERVVSSLSVFGFSYLGKEEGASWSETWHRPVQALRLLRIRGTLAGAGGPMPIEATFPVEPTMPRACVIDPLRPGCPSW